MIQVSVKKHHPLGRELNMLRKLICQVQLFGFHLATIDIRNHSLEHEAAINKILLMVKISENFLQVELIKQLRRKDSETGDILTEVLLTISGIAAGLRNTG